MIQNLLSWVHINLLFYNLEPPPFMGAIVNRCCDYEFYDPDSRRFRSSRSCSQDPIKSLPSMESLRKQTSLQEILKVQMVEQPPDQVRPIKEEDDQGSYIDEIIEESSVSKKQFQVLSFESFNVRGVFGQGSLGSVLQVELKQEVNHGIQQRYAMKRIPRQKLVNHKALASLKLEKEILGDMNHPFITQLKYAFTDYQFVYLVMEEATGGDAGSFIQSGKRRAQFSKLGQEGVKFIGASIVLALEYLHQKHILYRDLTAQNVLLFSDGYAKLSDFGLAKIISHDNQLHQSQAGSLLHSAPEMVMHLGYSKCVDFWALGVMFYELATGLTPFMLEDVSSKTRFKKVVKEEETAHEWRGIKISEQLENLVGGLLRYKPDQRLGVRGWFEIKEHKFFKNFDWQALASKTMKSPLLPLLQMHPSQVKSFKQSPVLSCKVDSISHLQTASEEALWDFDYQKRGKRR